MTKLLYILIIIFTLSCTTDGLPSTENYDCYIQYKGSNNKRQKYKYCYCYRAGEKLIIQKGKKRTLLDLDAIASYENKHFTEKRMVLEVDDD